MGFNDAIFFMYCVLTDIDALAQNKVVVVHVGSTATFSCSTTDWKNLSWTFSSTTFPSPNNVYEYPKVTDSFTPRYSASYDNLSISDVQLCDAGVYQCNRPIRNDDNLGTVKFQLITLGEFTIYQHKCHKPKAKWEIKQNLLQKKL